MQGNKTPLHLAESVEMAEFLIGSGVKIDAVDDVSWLEVRLVLGSVC